jgi:hypothetical protein
MIDYLLSCPKCGGQLAPFAGPPDLAPWVCHVCRNMFWCCELSSEARKLYRPNHGDWGYDGPKILNPLRAKERDDAHKRGTGTTSEMLGNLHPTQLQTISKLPNLDPPFAKQVNQQMKKVK